MEAEDQTTQFGEAVLKVGVLSVVTAMFIGIGSLVYYALGFSEEASALQLIKTRRWSADVKSKIQNTYINFFISLFICMSAAAVVFSEPTLFEMFSSPTMVIIDFVIDILVQGGKSFCYFDSDGTFSTRRICWILYSAFVGGIASPAFLLGSDNVAVAMHITTIIIIALLIMSLTAPAGKFAAWQKNLNVFEIFVIIGSIGAALYPVTTSPGATFFSISFYGGLVLFPMCFLCHSQQAHISASEATSENPYCSLAMSVPLLLDTVSIFTRIVVMVPPR